MKAGCFDCEVKKQRMQHKLIITQAREIAKKENRTVTIYRATDGSITLDPIGEPHDYITSFM